MKMLFVFILATLFSGYSKKEKLGCEILHALLKSKTATEVFYFDKHTEVPIIFIDTNYYFEGCELISQSGRKVKIVHDSSFLNEVNYSNIIINNVPQKNTNRFKITLYYKIRKAFFEVDLKRIKDSLIVTECKGGYF
jgi:hypothetical protein